MKRRQKRKHLENEESQETAEKGGGISKSQEDLPQLGSTVVAKGCSPGAGEVSSASTYFSCASSPHKLIYAGIRKSYRDTAQPTAPLAQDQEEGETAPPSHCVSSSPSSPCKNNLHPDKEERGMKIYYMQVQVNKGVAVSWKTKKPLELPEKQLTIEEVTLPEDVCTVATDPSSDVSTESLLSDSEPTGEEKEYEERAEPGSPSGSPTIQETPRAKTPDWMVTMETGFRCMACCRVFPTLEILQQHVKFGVLEGFSCRVFHLTMAQWMGNVESESTPEEEGSVEPKTTSEDEEDEEDDLL
ncbi:protein FAM170A-like [Mesoplodon densirostris]|uniref:protein FAM170A-like n=1 Tax=Mesoplodon densirostris TaxID=48708 RepID=UPI0028DC4A20|nr:protein FAM170A-like [Mesoplodon densirostris]